MSTGKLSISEIAKQAGTSITTVSRALNHPELVKAETAERINRAMEQLNYKPRFTKKKPTRKLIVINIPEITNPFYSEIIRGIVSSAESHDYYTLIHQDALKDGQSVDNFINLLKAVKACGTILLSPLEKKYYERIGSLIPIVQCCEYNSEEYSYVSIDDFQAAYSVMSHIYSQGCRKIIFINGPLKYKYARERQRGYEAFLEQNELVRSANWTINLPEVNYDTAFACVCQLLTSASRPDAIFTYSDLVAAAALKAAKLHDINVPEDLVIVGFDNINISSICDPAITTVNQPQFQLGYTSGEIIHEHISSPTAYMQKVLLKTELIIRDSSVPSKQNTELAI
ncbi:LacI family DNA-binding transcriptional regulator [Clostridium sp. Marseille-P3244]|uniref:LacI family DNA-binding transcriptional regulator n=1 Tax=Clostridium sp. Marseille-P3244 TaxID=1871020 RepID=UPI000B2FB6D4|nr:substrate-binding domain-containing protein [Clostridium sp. Marseille-P3244]